MNPNTDLKLYIEKRLAEYGYGEHQNPAKYNAYCGVYRIVMTRLGFIQGERTKIPKEMMLQAKTIVDDVLPSVNGQMMVDGYPRRSKLGAGQDWIITRNACETAMCIKRIGRVALHIFRHISDAKFTLYISGDPYLEHNHPAVGLRSEDWDSAANEADDIYREYLTQMVDYAKDQLSKLPEI